MSPRPAPSRHGHGPGIENLNSKRDLKRWLQRQLQDPAIIREFKRTFLEPDFVTDLPSDPRDKQEVFYLADGANGVVWHLAYRANAPSSPKWVYLGGPPLFAHVPDFESRTSATYGDLATVGPSITLPLAGDYDFEYGATTYSNPNTAGMWAARMSLSIGGAAAVDADAMWLEHEGTDAASEMISVAETTRRRKTGLAASDAVVAKYASDGVADRYWFERWLAVRPVRVG